MHLRWDFYLIIFLLYPGDVSVSYNHEWREKKSTSSSVSEDSRHSKQKSHRKLCCTVSRDSFKSSQPVDTGALDLATVDIPRNTERQW